MLGHSKSGNSCCGGSIFDFLAILEIQHETPVGSIFWNYLLYDILIILNELYPYTIFVLKFFKSKIIQTDNSDVMMHLKVVFISQPLPKLWIKE